MKKSIILFLIINIFTSFAYAGWKDWFESSPPRQLDISGTTAQGFVELNITKENNKVLVNGNTATMGFVEINLERSNNGINQSITGNTGLGGMFKLETSPVDKYKFLTSGHIASLGWVNLTTSVLNDGSYSIIGNTASIGFVNLSVKKVEKALSISGNTGKGFVNLKVNDVTKLEIQSLPVIILLSIK
tara:strand:- start:37008 stop:37571 length:564 start_codon:yes stop_codon:yes gene_type:complete